MSLSPILRRYIAGYKVLWVFLLDETSRAGLNDAESTLLLTQASVSLASLLGLVLATVAETHMREATRVKQSRAEKSGATVQALINLVPVDAHELDYNVEGGHVALIASGPGATRAMTAISSDLGRRVLSVPRSDGTVWGWLAGSERITESDVGRIVLEADARLAVGEPAVGRTGFRATHHQAQAARLVAHHQCRPVTFYADVLLLVPAVENQALGDALIAIYLSPLNEECERTPSLREALRAYLAAEGNTTSAAAMLKVDRRTASTRVREIEMRLGFPLRQRHAELEVALRLEQLRETGSADGSAATSTAARLDRRQARVARA
jgi:hypothetical protein